MRVLLPVAVYGLLAYPRKPTLKDYDTMIISEAGDRIKFDGQRGLRQGPIEVAIAISGPNTLAIEASDLGNAIFIRREDAERIAKFLLEAYRTRPQGPIGEPVLSIPIRIPER
jgi:hypothetical protein